MICGVLGRGFAAEHHVEEVRRVAQVVARRYRLEAVAHAVHRRDDRRGLRDQADPGGQRDSSGRVAA